jgi:hypothetical protein
MQAERVLIKLLIPASQLLEKVAAIHQEASDKEETGQAMAVALTQDQP